MWRHCSFRNVVRIKLSYLYLFFFFFFLYETDYVLRTIRALKYDRPDRFIIIVLYFIIQRQSTENWPVRILSSFIYFFFFPSSPLPARPAGCTTRRVCSAHGRTIDPPRNSDIIVRYVDDNILRNTSRRLDVYYMIVVRCINIRNIIQIFYFLMHT